MWSKSTLAAEAAALCEAQDHLEFGRVLFSQMLGDDFGRVWQQALDKIPGFLVVDARSLFDSLEAPAFVPRERRVALDHPAVREALECESDSVQWVPTCHVSADERTQNDGVSSSILHLCPSKGHLSLVQSAEAGEHTPQA